MYIITTFAAVGGFLFGKRKFAKYLILIKGYDTGVVSGAILFLQDEYKLSGVDVELFVSIALAGKFS